MFSLDGEGTVHTETGYPQTELVMQNYLNGQTAIPKMKTDTDLQHPRRKRTITIADGDPNSNWSCSPTCFQVVGNAGWNAWKSKYKVGDDGNPVTTKTKVVEWVDEVGVLHSYYLKSLDPTFALPENAVIYETMDDGSDIEVNPFYTQYNTEQEYTQRLKRG